MNADTNTDFITKNTVKILVNPLNVITDIAPLVTARINRLIILLKNDFVLCRVSLSNGCKFLLSVY